MSRMQKPFLLVIFIDLILLALVVITGRQVYGVLGKAIATVPTTPTATLDVYQELQIKIITPDQIIEDSDFDIRVEMTNPDNEDVQVKLIVFPHNLVDTMNLVGTSHPIGEKVDMDEGVGLPVDILIRAGETQYFSGTWRSNKMLAIAGRVYIFTDHAKQEASLALAVAPMPATYTPEPTPPADNGETELSMTPTP